MRQTGLKKRKRRRETQKSTKRRKERGKNDGYLKNGQFMIKVGEEEAAVEGDKR